MTLPVVDYPPDDWDKVVAVNLTAMFDVTRLAIPHLKTPQKPASSSTCRRSLGALAFRIAAPTPPPNGA